MMSNNEINQVEIEDERFNLLLKGQPIEINRIGKWRFTPEITVINRSTGKKIRCSIGAQHFFECDDTTTVTLVKDY